MQILNIFHVLVAIALVGLVLIQKGQGATAGASFGAGASATVFGARGAGTFLTRATWTLAALFCVISLVMAVVVSRTVGVPETDLGVIGDTPAETVEPEPVVLDEQLPDTQSDADSDIPAFEDSGTGGADDVPDFAPESGAGNSLDDGVTGEQEVDESLPPPVEDDNGEE